MTERYLPVVEVAERIGVKNASAKNDSGDQRRRGKTEHLSTCSPDIGINRPRR